MACYDARDQRKIATRIANPHRDSRWYGGFRPWIVDDVFAAGADGVPAVLAVNDRISIGRIPGNGRLRSARIIHGALGAGCQLSLGVEADLDKFIRAGSTVSAGALEMGAAELSDVADYVAPPEGDCLYVTILGAAPAAGVKVLVLTEWAIGLGPDRSV